MATFDDKAKELKKLLELFKKYAEDGKYDSINLRGQHSKVASLGKLLDLENEKQVKLFHELEQEYHNIVALKKRGTASLQEVTKKTTQRVVTVKKEIQNLESVEDVLSSFQDESDIAANSVQLAKTIKGSQKEQEVTLALIKEFVRLNKERESLLKSANEKRKKLNKSLLDDNYYGYYTQSKLDKILKNQGYAYKDKNGAFKINSNILSNVMRVLTDGNKETWSEAEILRSISNEQNAITLSGRPRKQKTIEDNIGNLPLGSSNTTHPYNTGAASRGTTKKVANISNFIEHLMSSFGNVNYTNGKLEKGKKSPVKNADNFKQFGGYKERFRQFVHNATQANLEYLGNPDISSFNDSLGVRYATIEQLLNSENLPEEYQRLFGTYTYNKHNKKGKQPDILTWLADMKKSAAKFRNYSFAGFSKNGSIQLLNGSNKMIRVKSMEDVAKITDLQGAKINEDDIKNYSAFHTLFPGLALDKETDQQLAHWSRMLSNRGVELTPSNMKILNSGKPLSESDLNQLTGKRSKSYGHILPTVNKPESIVTTNTTPALGGVASTVSFNSSDILKAIGGVQYRLDEIIKLLGGEASAPAIAHSRHGSATDLIEGEEESAPETGKSAYQVNQENNSKVRTRHRSFISMLIPEIAKILRKNPVWDAIKLLLFKFGQSHPKLAATALLGGPAVITGALAIASKAVFRNTVRDAVKGIFPSAGAAVGGTSLISKASTKISKGSASVFNSFNQMGDILNNAEQAYVDNKNWIKYLKDEEKTLQKKVLLGKASRLVQQNQTANALNNPAIARNIAEGLKAEKDLKYINKVLPLREKATPTGFIKSLWSEAVPEIVGGIKAIPGALGRFVKSAPSALKGFIKSAPGAIGGLVKATPGAIATGVKGIAKGFWDISKPATALKAMGKVGAGAKALGPVGTALMTLMEIPDLITAAKSGKPGALKTQASKSVGGVTGSLAGAAVGSAILPVVGTAIGAIIGDIIGRILGPAFMDGFSVLGKDFKKDFKALWDGLKDVFTGLGKVIVPIVRFVGRLMIPSFKLLGFILGGLVKTLTWSLNIIGKTLGWVGKTISNIADAIHQSLQRMWDKMKTIPLVGPVVKKIEELYSTSADKEGSGSESSSTTNDIGGKVGSTTVLTNNTNNYTNGVKASDVHKKHYGSIDGHAITSGFGYRGDIGVKNASPYHRGVDLAYRKGEAVGAKHAGKVVFAGKQSGYGNVVYVQEDDGTVQRYGHLNSINVTKGQQVGVGTKLGGAGNTGTSGGVHLHYEVRDKNGKALDPAAYELGQKIYGTGGSAAASATPEQLAKIQQTNDDVRSSLMNLAMQTNAKNKKESVDKIVWDTTDVTGSLGCWGIVQLNNTGQLVY